jgi:hypothetical protein
MQCVRFVWMLWITTHCLYLDTDWTARGGCLRDMLEEESVNYIGKFGRFWQSQLQKGEKWDRIFLDQWELRIPKVPLFRASNSEICEDIMISGDHYAQVSFAEFPQTLLYNQNITFHHMTSPTTCTNSVGDSTLLQTVRTRHTTQCAHPKDKHHLNQN